MPARPHCPAREQAADAAPLRGVQQRYGFRKGGFLRGALYSLRDARAHEECPGETCEETQTFCNFFGGALRCSRRPGRRRRGAKVGARAAVIPGRRAQNPHASGSVHAGLGIRDDPDDHSTRRNRRLAYSPGHTRRIRPARPLDDGAPRQAHRTYQTGETFSIVEGEVHQAINPGKTAVRGLAILIVDKSKPMTTQVP